MASIPKENSDISDFEGFTAEHLADNVSVVPDSDPDSSDIEFLQLVAVTFLTCTLSSQT